ncbi:MAG: hypothetical protein PHI31_09005, partial [Desulfuromonadaceae bacterium]|nr:hypothetical protein [Desulfuromonadaceae bacterium]
VVLLTGGIFAYKSYVSAQMYAENYIKALYCIKTGADANLKKGMSNKAQWESAIAAGRSFSPVSNTVEETKAVKLRTEVEKYMQLINEPSSKFTKAHSNLKEFYKVYVDTETLPQSKPGSVLELSRLIDNLNKKMSQTSQDLKSSLPESLKQELEKARLKYRGMNDF